MTWRLCILSTNDVVSQDWPDGAERPVPGEPLLVEPGDAQYMICLLSPDGLSLLSSTRHYLADAGAGVVSALTLKVPLRCWAIAGEYLSWFSREVSTTFDFEPSVGKPYDVPEAVADWSAETLCARIPEADEVRLSVSNNLAGSVDGELSAVRTVVEWWCRGVDGGESETLIVWSGLISAALSTWLPVLDD